MSLSLRPYQREAVDAINAFFVDHGGNPLVVLPTGGGKSLVIATYMQECIRDYPDTRILCVAHVPELLEQNYAELIGFWPSAPAGIYSAKLGKRQMHKQIVFAGIQSIHRKAVNLQKVDIVLIDEAHLIPRTDNTMYRRFLGDLAKINPYLKIVGLTATPYRLDSGMLHKGPGAIFHDIAYDANVRDLIEAGFLSPLISRPAKRQIDTDGVHTRGGEFDAKELEAVAVDPETVNAIADEIVANSEGRHGILAFGCGVNHSRMMSDALNARGITCETIFGDTPAAERKRILHAFKAKRIRALSSMGVLTTGFNAKHVDMIALARATKSTGLYIQIVGRGTRLYPGKENCLVLDFGGNIARHGPIDRPNPAKERKEREGDGTAPEKECPECGAKNPIAARECADCGHVFPPVQQIITTQAASLDIMSRTDLTPQWVEVNRVRYDRHRKAGSPDSIKVTYQCGLIEYREWVCVQHEGGARRKAEAWWRRFSHPGDPVPTTVDDALSLTRTLAWPKEIAIRPDGAYTAIMGYRDLQQPKPQTPGFVGFRAA